MPRGEHPKARDLEQLLKLNVELMEAAEEGNVTAVVAALAAGAQVNARHSLYARMAPLHVAAFNGHAQVIKELVSAGALLERRDARHLTSLHLAVQEGRAEAARTLVAAGARLHAKQALLNLRRIRGMGSEYETERACTPAAWARELGDPEVLAALNLEFVREKTSDEARGGGGSEARGGSEEDTSRESEVLQRKPRSGSERERRGRRGRKGRSAGSGNGLAEHHGHGTARSRLRERVTKFAHRAVAENIKAHNVFSYLPLSSDSTDSEDYASS